MSNSLQNLCANFCAAAQVPAPELREQDNGGIAFTVVWRDVAVDLMARPFDDPGHVFVVFHLGTPDPAHGDFSRILQALLHANFLTLGTNQPVFSCHPQTHGVMLQGIVALDSGLAGDELHQVVEQGVDLALQWRQTHFLAPAASGPTALGSPMAASYA